MAKRVEKRSREANRQRRNAQSGLCASCGTRCSGYRCAACNEARREKARLLMRDRRASGLAD